VDVPRDAQSRDERRGVVQLEDHFEDLRVDALEGVVGAYVLAAHAAADLDDAPFEPAPAPGVGDGEAGRPQLDLGDVALVDVDADAQFARVAQDEQRLRARGRSARTASRRRSG
jgi:hypothetical protein